ncbi:hypothetical protein ABZ914_17930 [Spirillospora sp. NPDC046719]
MLKSIPGALRARIDRSTARRRYADLQDTLNETFDDLYLAQDHDDRAALQDRAAQLTEQLAETHTAAWGREADADGRPMAYSLAGQAALLRQVAATERAVIGAVPWADAEPLPGDKYRTELLAWTELAHTSTPDRRASCLRRLHSLAAEHLGGQAAEVLVVLAEVEEHRAHGSTERPSRHRLSRVLIGALMAVLAVVGVVPGLDVLGRIVLWAVVLGTAYVALCVCVGVRGRAEGVNR